MLVASWSIDSIRILFSNTFALKQYKIYDMTPGIFKVQGSLNRASLPASLWTAVGQEV